MSAGVPERLGAAEAMEACAEMFDSKDIHTALEFLLERGLADESPQVREKLVSAGMDMKPSWQKLYSDNPLLPQKVVQLINVCLATRSHFG